MQDESLRETRTHGKTTFHYAVYQAWRDRDNPIRLHWHNEAEIMYVESGRGVATVQSHSYEVGAGDIVVILPQAVHSVTVKDDGVVRYFTVLFDFALLGGAANDPCYEKYFAPFYTHAKQPPLFTHADHEFNRMILPHLKYLIDARKAEDDELMIKSELFAVMDCINKFGTPSDSSELLVKNNYDKLKNLLLYVKSNFASDITVADAATLCGYSPSHFMRLFRELMGQGFTEYLIDYRLEIAADKLADTNNKIIDIALGTGFNNPSYFTRMFRDKYGVTPSVYRSQT